MIKSVYWSFYSTPVIPARFELKLIILERFSKNSQTTNYTKTRPVGSEMLNEGRETDGQT